MLQRRVVYGAFAVLAAAAWWLTQSFGTGPALLPRLASGTMGILALAGMFERAPATDIESVPGASRGIFVILAFALYGILMPLLGFLVSTVMIAAGFVLGAAGLRAGRWALVGVAFVLLVYVAFSSVFLVSFPAGIAR